MGSRFTNLYKVTGSTLLNNVVLKQLSILVSIAVAYATEGHASYRGVHPKCIHKLALCDTWQGAIHKLACSRYAAAGHRAVIARVTVTMHVAAAAQHLRLAEEGRWGLRRALAVQWRPCPAWP